VSKKLILKMHVGAMLSESKRREAHEAWKRFVESDGPNTLIVCADDELVIGEFSESGDSMKIILPDGIEIEL